MGVKSLSTYIRENVSKCIEKDRLQNCGVVIDGNNLAHDLYYQCPAINSCFGGDYDKFATYVQEYFQTLVSIVLLRVCCTLMQYKYTVLYLCLCVYTL